MPNGYTEFRAWEPGWLPDTIRRTSQRRKGITPVGSFITGPAPKPNALKVLGYIEAERYAAAFNMRDDVERSWVVRF